MKPHLTERAPRTAPALIALAVLLLALALLTNRGDITSATLVLVAFACFFGGLFSLGFHRTETVAADLASLLAVPGSISFARLCADLGVQGNACILPAPPSARTTLLQYNPVSVPGSVEIETDFSFLLGNDGNSGVVSVPAGYHLFEHLTRTCALRVPADEEGVFEVMREAGEEVLDIAEEVRARRAGDEIVVELRRFRLAAGCRKMREESPKCCTMAPCAVCSLMGCILCTGLQRAVEVRSVTPDDENGGITLVLSPAP